ncbi:MAG: gliding motility-associated protein GldE [Bacteroidia bacterium]|nr:gliding motility-associated protein GldE [Bacteroidia bacterium]
METDPYPAGDLLNITLNPPNAGDFIGLLVIIILLAASACIAGAEVAFFSLTPSQIDQINERKGRKANFVADLLKTPERLLATILVANNFVNVGVVIISSWLSNSLFDFGINNTLWLVVQIILVTFLILLFGEILPKVYANQSAVKFALFMAFPLVFLTKILRPVSSMLLMSSSIVNKKLAAKKQNISMHDLSGALAITEDEIAGDKKILKGIVRFGNIDVKEIMTPRMDLMAIEYSTRSRQLLSTIIQSGYSRIPVYEEHLDNIRGILYIKDLLPFIKMMDDFAWQKLIRPAYFVPETMKISDLLEEFQKNKNHIAVVIDEYGGTFGIVTLEDILEEVVGEITDELDDDDLSYTKIDKDNFIFEGKTLLKDLVKITGLPDDYFEDSKGDADTLAGLILELTGEIPQRNQVVSLRNIEFVIKSADNRRIKQITVRIDRSVHKPDEP